MVYCLIDPRTMKRRYIGYTNCSVESRLKAHIWWAKSGENSHKSNWIRSLTLQGLVPIIHVLLPNGTLEDEICLIASHKLNGCNLTNGTLGGDGGLITRETAQKISDANRGRLHSENWNKKVGDALRGRKGLSPSQETREKIGKANRGKIFSQEQKQKVSDSKRGKPLSKEHVEKVIQSLKTYYANKKLKRENDESN